MLETLAHRHGQKLTGGAAIGILRKQGTRNSVMGYQALPHLY